jgi:hypothetical protein
MNNKLYIPEKIRVGFQKREDTYTQKLAYVIYYDEKGKIRKEVSFDGWRDHEIDVLELDNKPRSGYLFNKGVKRYAYHFGSGRSMLRVYDPRDFEFEIDIDNLEAVLMNSDISKKEIMGDFVFAWSGKDLILLPVNSQEYKDSVQYTENQYKKISTKDLIKGATYSQKKNNSQCIYVGFFEWNDRTGYGGINTKIVNKGKKHIFFERIEEEDVDSYSYLADDGFRVLSVSTFSECINDEPVEDYPEIVKAYEDSYHSQKSLGFVFGDIKTLFTEGYYSNRSGDLIKQLNDKQYAIVSIEKKDSYEIQEKNYYGELEYSFRCSLYEKVGERFEQINLQQQSYRYHRSNDEFEYKNFQKRIGQEIFGDNNKILLKDMKKELEKAGYKRPCTLREDGKLFYIDTRFQRAA